MFLSNIQHDFPGYPVDGAYFDSATLGLQPMPAINAQYEFDKKSSYTVRKALHSKAREAEIQYYQSKETFAEYINVSEENIAWIPNADIGIILMIHSVIDSLHPTKLRVYSSIFDHHSILASLHYLHKQGKIDLVLTESREEVCLTEYLEANLEENDILMFGHTTQTLGLLREVEKISDIASSLGARTIFDFSRTVGQTKINLQKWGVDIGIFDGAIDLLGPQGSGFLYINSKWIDQLNNPFPSSGNVGKVTSSDVFEIQNIQKFELGAPNVRALAGLTQSVKYIRNLGINNVENHRTAVIQYLTTELNELEHIGIVDPFMDKLCNHENRGNIVSLHGDFHAHDFALFLDEVKNVQTRSGLLCSHPGVNELSLEEILQISTHVYTTKEDVDRLISGLQEISSMMG